MTLFTEKLRERAHEIGAYLVAIQRDMDGMHVTQGDLVAIMKILNLPLSETRFAITDSGEVLTGDDDYGRSGSLHQPRRWTEQDKQAAAAHVAEKLGRTTASALEAVAAALPVPREHQTREVVRRFGWHEVPKQPNEAGPELRHIQMALWRDSILVMLDAGSSLDKATEDAETLVEHFTLRWLEQPEPSTSTGCNCEACREPLPGGGHLPCQKKSRDPHAQGPLPLCPACGNLMARETFCLLPGCSYSADGGPNGSKD